MVYSQAISGAKRAFCLYSMLVLFSALFLSGLATQVSAASYSKETVILTPAVPAGEKAAPEAPFTGGHEREAAHTLLTGEYPNVPYVDVINYAAGVEGKNSDSLTLDCTLSKAEDKATLDRIADSIYQQSNGGKYKTMTINWHIGSNPEPANPWARTIITQI